MEPCLFIVRRQLSLSYIITSLHVHTMAFIYQTNVHQNSECTLISMQDIHEFESERRGRTNLTSGLSLCTRSLESAGTFINGRSLVRWSCPDVHFS